MRKNTRFKASSKLILCLFLLMGLTLPGSLLAETLYAKASRTKLQKSASARSPVVGLMRKGTAVKVIKKGKRYYMVSVSGKKGWVFKYKLTSKRPSSSGSGFGGMLGGSKVADSGRSSGSGIRGLNPISKEYARRNKISESDIAAVEHMEKLTVGEKELDKFLADGKLREYGE